MKTVQFEQPRSAQQASLPVTTQYAAIFGGSATLVERLCRTCAACGLVCRTCSSQQELLSTLRQTLVAIAVLDTSGLCANAAVATVRLIRAIVPHVVILATVPESSTVGIGPILDADADDCLASPFRDDELAARIRIRLRNRTNLPHLAWHTGAPLAFNWGDSCISTGDKVLALRRTEFNVLAYLASNAGRYVSTREILHAVLGSAGDGGAVRNHIMALRRVLADAGLRDLIVTHRCSGYRFNDGVRSVTASA